MIVLNVGNLEELKARTLLCRYRDLPIQISETSFVHPTLVTPVRYITIVHIHPVI